jgi:ABC-type transport system involved in multi-copper enzyme maturation permease subunit
MPRPLAWLLFVLWLAAVGLLADHARRAAWGPGEVLLGFAGWLLLPLFVVPGEVRRLFGPVFAYEALRLGRRRLTFVLRGLYVLLLMGLLVWVYVLWLDWVRGYSRRQEGVGLWVVPAALGIAGLAALVAWLAGPRWRWPIRSAAAAAILVTVLVGAAGSDTPVAPAKLASFATWFFNVFVFIQFGVVALLTPAYVAGTVADEKERKTLEFLLATDLAPREILFGKLAARVASLLMYVLAGLPVVAFLQLFGGIDPDLLLTATAAAAVTVLGFSAVAVFFSTTLRKPRDAIALTYLLLAVYLFGSIILAGYLIGLAVRFGPQSGPWTETLFGFVIDMHPVIEAAAWAAGVFAQGNPVFQVLMLIEPITGRGGLTPTNMAAALGRYALFWAAVGGLLMAYSVWRLRPIALGHNKAPTQKVIDRQARRRPAVGTDPMLWKEVFLESGFKGGCIGWLVGALVAGLVFVWPPIIVYNTYFSVSGFPPGSRDRWELFTREINMWCRLSTGAVGTLMLLAAAVRGAGAVSGERDRDTWVSLVSTPLGAWEMLRGKWLGCVLGVRRGFAVLLAVWAVGLACRAVEPVTVLLLVGALGVYLGTFAWVGVLCSLTARTTLIATVRAVAAGGFLAGGYWLAFGMCCLAPLSLVTGGSSRRDFDALYDLMMGLTPPIVLGWLPVRRFDRWDLEPFSGDDSLGVASPLIGMVVWTCLGLLLARTCHQGFTRVTNRGRDDVPTGRRPAPGGPGS